MISKEQLKLDLAYKGYIEIFDGQHIEIIRGGLYYIAEGEATVTQSGGYCLSFYDSKVHNVQSGGIFDAYDNAKIYCILSGGHCMSYDDSTAHVTQSGGNCHSYDNATVYNSYTDGKYKSYGHSIMSIS